MKNTDNKKALCSKHFLLQKKAPEIFFVKDIPTMPMIQRRAFEFLLIKSEEAIFVMKTIHESIHNKQYHLYCFICLMLSSINNKHDGKKVLMQGSCFDILGYNKYFLLLIM